MTARKYTKGERIKTLPDAVRLIESGKPMFERHKVQNTGWMLSWRLNYLRALVHGGNLHLAIPKDSTK